MRSEIRELKKYAKELKRAADSQIERDAEGRAVIRVGVSDRESVFNPFSTADRLSLSEEFAATVEGRAKGIFKEKRLAVEVACANGCEVSEREIKSAFHNYYADKIAHQAGRYGRNGALTLTMLLIGLAFLAASLTLGGFGLIAEMFTGVLDIAAWVFIWEAVDKFFFERNVLKIEYVLYSRLAKAEVSVR